MVRNRLVAHVMDQYENYCKSSLFTPSTVSQSDFNTGPCFVS